MQETSTGTRVRRPAEGARVPYRSLPVPQTERDPPCLSTRKVNPPYYPQAGEGRPSCPAAGPGDGKHSSADEEPSPPRTLTSLHCTFVFLLLTTSLPFNPSLRPKVSVSLAPKDPAPNILLCWWTTFLPLTKGYLNLLQAPFPRACARRAPRPERRLTPPVPCLSLTSAPRSPFPWPAAAAAAAR